MNSFPLITLHSNHVVSADKPIEYTSDFPIVIVDRDISFWSPKVIPRASEIIGERIGAINIDPIITEALFINKPKLLTSEVTKYLKIVTNEKNTCRLEGKDGACLESDYVFNLSEQPLIKYAL